MKNRKEGAVGVVYQVMCITKQLPRDLLLLKTYKIHSKTCSALRACQCRTSSVTNDSLHYAIAGKDDFETVTRS